MMTITDIASGKPFVGPLFEEWQPEKPQDVSELHRLLDVGSGDVIPRTPSGGIPAAWIIGHAGLADSSMGHVRLAASGESLVVEGAASVSDVAALVATVKTRVRNTTQGLVELRENIDYAGVA